MNYFLHYWQMGFNFAGKAVYTAVWVAAVSLFMELLGFSTQKWLTAGGLGTVLLTLAGREVWFKYFLSSWIFNILWFAFSTLNITFRNSINMWCLPFKVPFFFSWCNIRYSPTSFQVQWFMRHGHLFWMNGFKQRLKDMKFLVLLRFVSMSFNFFCYYIFWLPWCKWPKKFVCWI